MHTCPGERRQQSRTPTCRSPVIPSKTALWLPVQQPHGSQYSSPAAPGTTPCLGLPALGRQPGCLASAPLPVSITFPAAARSGRVCRDAGQIESCLINKVPCFARLQAA